MKTMIVALTLACVPAGPALSEGCVLDGGTTAPEISAMNQMILDLRVDDFARTMEAVANMNVSGAMKSVGEAYVSGFEGCRTLLQRKDIGGLTQELVMFRSPVGPLFLYWMYLGTGADFTLVQFKLDSDLDLLDNLR